MFTTSAIVIKEVDYRDNDKMLALFSPKYGRIDALSRGCKKQGSKLMASSQLFNCGEYTFNSKKDKNYHSGCVIKHSFYNLRDNYEKLFTASFFVEMISAFIMPNQEDKKIYALLLNSLFSLENNLNKPHDIIQFFLVKLSDLVGLRPYIEKCMSCDESKISFYFSFDEGGILCLNCARKTLGKKRRITEKTINIMESIFSLPSKSICEKYDVSFSKSLVDIMFVYLQDKSHLKIKSYNLLKQIVTS